MVEHDFYLMSEWMCGPGVTPLFTCVPESMSSYSIMRLSVVYENVAVYYLIVILRLIERLVFISIEVLEVVSMDETGSVREGW